MFNEKYLESAEFYRRRYSTYSTILITPLFLSVVILIFFSMFGKREITIESPGQITPKKTLSLIQSTSNNKIDKINIHENQFVKKGEKLIEYKNSDGEITNKLLDLQIINTNNKITALDTFKNSILSGKNLFSKPDNFGYMNLYNNFLNQINDMNAGLQQTNSDRINDGNQAKNQVNTLGDSKKGLDAQIEKIQDVIKAIQSDRKVDNSNNYKYLFDNYNSQISDLSPDDKNKLKQDTLTELNTQINSLKDNKTSIDQQIAGIKVENTVSPNQVNAQIGQLKEKTIADIQNQRQSSELLIDQFEAKQKVQKIDDGDLVLKASNTGIVHLDTDLPM
ncbi:bacteriocin secretion accessory protein [Weissella muntiaci]|nr:bacteriocin secretion accessory protein [Weissella muntiaci]